MQEQARLIEQLNYRRQVGDRIEVVVGGHPEVRVEVASCRIYTQGIDLCEDQDRIDMGDRRKTGYVSGSSLSSRRLGPAGEGLARLDRFRLIVQPRRKKRGGYAVMVFDCRVDRRRSEFWSFTILAEGGLDSKRPKHDKK